MLHRVTLGDTSSCLHHRIAVSTMPTYVLCRRCAVMVLFCDVPRASPAYSHCALTLHHDCIVSVCRRAIAQLAFRIPALHHCLSRSCKGMQCRAGIQACTPQPKVQAANEIHRACPPSYPPAHQSTRPPTPPAHLPSSKSSESLQSASRLDRT